MCLNLDTRNYTIILVDETAINTFKINIKQALLDDLKINSDLNISKLNNTFLITQLETIYYFCYFQTNMDWFVTNYLANITKHLPDEKLEYTYLNYFNYISSKIKKEELVNYIIKIENGIQPKIKLLDWIDAI